MFKTEIGKLNAAILFVLLSTCVADLAIKTDVEERAEIREERERSDPKRLARNLCMLWIEDSLNDPDSADFGNYWQWPVSTDEMQIFTMSPTIRAKNMFGATVKSTFICIVHRTENGEWMKIDLTES